MHLIWATDQFTIGGRAYPGFPIILDETMSSVVEVNEFLRSYLTRGVIGSERSWPSTGRALYDYFGFLEAHDLHWTDVNSGDEKSLVASYRDYCLKDIKLARQTVRQRLLYICSFYEYGLKQGWISRLPFSKEERTVPISSDAYANSHQAGSGTKTVRDVMPRHHRTMPKFLAKHEVVSLVAATTNIHHRMILLMALQTGLRVEELATFPLSYVFNPDTKHGNGRNVRVVLDPSDGSGMSTKGSKEREIWIPRRFMAQLYRYSILNRGELASNSKAEHPTLFLTQEGKPFAGHGKHIEVFVRESGKRAGIKVHPHMLRHTYATHMLVTLQRNRSKNTVEPLVFLQRQLGHAQISTTMIYLHLVNSLVDDAVLAYDDELNDWLDIQ